MKKNMKILNEKFVIISVMGPHAGESSEQIFSRKIKDIERTGNTFWMIQSYKSNPPKVQSLVKKAKLVISPRPIFTKVISRKSNKEPILISNYRSSYAVP